MTARRGPSRARVVVWLLVLAALIGAALVLANGSHLRGDTHEHESQPGRQGRAGGSVFAVHRPDEPRLHKGVDP